MARNLANHLKLDNLNKNDTDAPKQTYVFVNPLCGLKRNGYLLYCIE